MKRIVTIGVLAVIFFLIEFVLFNLLGRWVKPNLSIVLIVFFNLYLGIRYSLVAAFFCGILFDSFSTGIFGMHTFSFFVCAYLTTFVKRYIYQVGSNASRVQMVLIICIVNVLILFILNVMLARANFGQVMSHVMVPELLTTAIVASDVLKQLRKFVLKFSV